MKQAERIAVGIVKARLAPIPAFVGRLGIEFDPALIQLGEFPIHIINLELEHGAARHMVGIDMNGKRRGA